MRVPVRIPIGIPIPIPDDEEEAAVQAPVVPQPPAPPAAVGIRIRIPEKIGIACPIDKAKGLHRFRFTMPLDLASCDLTPAQIADIEHSIANYPTNSEVNLHGQRWVEISDASLTQDTTRHLWCKYGPRARVARSSSHSSKVQRMLASMHCEQL